MPRRPALPRSTYASRASAKRHALRVQAVRQALALAAWVAVPLCAVGFVAIYALPKVQALALAVATLP